MRVPELALPAAGDNPRFGLERSDPSWMWLRGAKRVDKAFLVGIPTRFLADKVGWDQGLLVGPAGGYFYIPLYQGSIWRADVRVDVGAKFDRFVSSFDLCKGLWHALCTAVSV